MTTRILVVDDEPRYVRLMEANLISEITRYEHESVSVQAALNDSGILVLADSYYPGWRAYVDGSEAPILKANHFFRAFALTAGEHVVEFKYAPQSFRIGALVSLLTIFLVAAISIGVAIKRLKSRQRSPLGPQDQLR